MMIERAAHHFGRNAARQVEMRGLAQRMHAGIGAPRAVHGNLLAAEPGDGGFERLLHREAIRLALPADEPVPSYSIVSL